MYIYTVQRTEEKEKTTYETSNIFDAITCYMKHIQDNATQVEMLDNITGVVLAYSGFTKCEQPDYATDEMCLMMIGWYVLAQESGMVD